MPRSWGIHHRTQIGVYSAVRHSFQAAQAAGSNDRNAIVHQMRTLPVDDVFGSGVHVRPDRIMVHPMPLEQVKSPGESKSEWDVFEVLRRVDGETAFGPMRGCELAR